MENLNTALKAFWQDEAGLTMVEYAVAGSLICLGAVAAFTTLGTKVAGSINYMSGLMKTG